jgi:hypothetical protein
LASVAIAPIRCDIDRYANASAMNAALAALKSAANEAWNFALSEPKRPAVAHAMLAEGWTWVGSTSALPVEFENCRAGSGAPSCQLTENPGDSERRQENPSQRLHRLH